MPPRSETDQLSRRGSPDSVLRQAELRSWYRGLAVVVLAALIMGAPAVRGTFLSGDDIQFARDNVLVNRPSVAHSLEIFRIVHRDLYQPVALLSFALDFAVVRGLGWEAWSWGGTPGAGLLHLSNVLLHGLNAALVYVLVRRMFGRDAPALVAGLLFAVHPLGVETVAWLSGRMMLLSTLFALGTVLLFDWARTRRGWGGLAGALFCCGLSMMSKVCVALPILVLIPTWVRGETRPRRWWIGWAGVVVCTAAFVWVNTQASSGIVGKGQEVLQGPRTVRTIQALAWYSTRLVWPTGLSPSHPAAELASWREPGLVTAGLVVAAGGLAVILSLRAGRVGWCGALWFVAAVAATLPLIPTRNLAFAERYTYLPNVGLYWIFGVLFERGWMALRTRWGPRGSGVAAGLVGAAVVLTLFPLSWHAAGYYRSDVQRTARVWQLYPHLPGLGVRHAWMLYEAGRYAEAQAAALADLARHGDRVAVDGQQVIGMSRFRQGDVSGAEAALRAALVADPAAGLAWARLGTVYAESARLDEAIAAYERCAELMPNYNPGLVQLGKFYAQQGRTRDARRVYAQALANNRYEVGAILGIAEADISEGRHREALASLEGLLNWMPEHVPARINAGVCRAALGDVAGARAEYSAALACDPTAGAAVLNLAMLATAPADWRAVEPAVQAYLRANPADHAVLLVFSERLLAAGRGPEAAAAWLRALQREPQRADLHGGLAWTGWQGGKLDLAGQEAASALRLDARDDLGRLVSMVLALHAGRVDEAWPLLDGLLADQAFRVEARFQVAAAALETLAQRVPESPWPYLVLARIFRANGRPDAARAAAAEFLRRNADPVWRQRVEAEFGIQPGA